MSSLTLHAGDLRLALRPDLGGAIAGLWHAGRPVLRSTEPEALEGVRLGGGFALLPYSNRLAQGRFRWAGRTHQLRLNFPGRPHPLHGCGWQRPWQVLEQGPSHAVLGLHHVSDEDWPFAFDARQTLRLRPEGLAWHLALTNRDASPMPAGLGWHPYFPRAAGTTLHARVDHRWAHDETGLPLRREPWGGFDGEVAPLAGLDHGFEGWDGAARVDQPGLSVDLAADVDRLVVFVPPQGTFFCVEPVSHRTDAIHADDPAAHGLVDLAPGETLDGTLHLRVTPATLPADTRPMGA